MRGDELAVWPQVGLVHENVAAAFEDQPGGPGLGDPGAVDVALLEGGEGVGVGLRQDRDIAPAGRVGREPLVSEPGPQGHVLGVAQRRRGQLGASEVGRTR